MSVDALANITKCCKAMAEAAMRAKGEETDAIKSISICFDKSPRCQVDRNYLNQIAEEARKTICECTGETGGKERYFLHKRLHRH